MTDLAHQALDRYAAEAARRLGPTTRCSILLRRHQRLVHAGSNDARAARCDQVEVSTGDGPCVVALQSMSGVLVPDIQQEVQWPAWRAAALDAGFASAAALPGYVDDETRLALNLYADTLDPWDAHRLTAMDAFIQEIAEDFRLTF